MKGDFFIKCPKCEHKINFSAQLRDWQDITRLKTMPTPCYTAIFCNNCDGPTACFYLDEAEIESIHSPALDADVQFAKPKHLDDTQGDDEEEQLVAFLAESNLIEEVDDEDSFMDAVKAWDYISNKKVLTVKNLLTTHKILMQGHLEESNRGHFRTQPIYIGGTEGKPWFALSDLMAQWVKAANLTLKAGKTDLEEAIKRDHIAFERIHPFIDGNGRLGRILMNWQRIRADLPILVIKNAEKEEYYKWFKDNATRN